MKDYYTTQEAAPIIGCGEWTAISRIKDGTICGGKVDGRWRFNIEDTHRYAEIYRAFTPAELKSRAGQASRSGTHPWRTTYNPKNKRAPMTHREKQLVIIKATHKMKQNIRPKEVSISPVYKRLGIKV